MKILVYGVCFLLLLLYFINSVMHGKKWKSDYKAMQMKYNAKQKDLDNINKNILTLKVKIAEMRNYKKNPDLMELEIKKNIGLYRSSEIVVSGMH